jgi:hypothetical protein
VIFFEMIRQIVAPRPWRGIPPLSGEQRVTAGLCVVAIAISAVSIGLAL